MKLVFYSGGFFSENKKLNHALLDLYGKARPRVTFIPASSEGGVDDFQYFVKSFDAYGVQDYFYFPVDVPVTNELTENALSSDIVFLSGGNTFYFLYHLKKSGVLPKLKEAAKKGTILAGLSAGGIVMTPSIRTASEPEFDCDDNWIELKNLKSLGLVNFEFFPHFEKKERYLTALKQMTKKSALALFGCADGAGIVVAENEVKLLGQAFCFNHGNSFSFKFTS